MAGITIQMAEKKLSLWLEAEEALATSQSYTIGSRTLTRANLAEVRNQIEYWNNYIQRLNKTEGSRGRNRIIRGVPRDL